MTNAPPLLPLPPPPFIANRSDDMHCFEACLGMALGSFLPEWEFTWESIVRLTGKRPGYWTWPQQALLALRAMGLDVKETDTFDYAAFLDHQEEYVIELYGRKIGGEQVRNSDIPHELEVARAYLPSGIHYLRAPTLDDVRSELKSGRLVLCNVNAKSLKGKKGYAGHSVLVYGMDEDGFHLHDPGLPPARELSVGFNRFLDAWHGDNGGVASMISIRPGHV